MYDVAKLSFYSYNNHFCSASCVIQFNNAYKWLTQASFMSIYISRWGKVCDSVM